MLGESARHMWPFLAFAAPIAPNTVPWVWEGIKACPIFAEALFTPAFFYLDLDRTESEPLISPMFEAWVGVLQYHVEHLFCVHPVSRADECLMGDISANGRPTDTPLQREQSRQNRAHDGPVYYSPLCRANTERVGPPLSLQTDSLSNNSSSSSSNRQSKLKVGMHCVHAIHGAALDIDWYEWMMGDGF